MAHKETGDGVGGTTAGGRTSPGANATTTSNSNRVNAGSTFLKPTQQPVVATTAGALR